LIPSWKRKEAPVFFFLQDVSASDERAVEMIFFNRKKRNRSWKKVFFLLKIARVVAV